MDAAQLLKTVLDAQVETPALILDEIAMQQNIDAMAERAHRHSVTLRPHAKTHKSIAIGRKQIEAGAVGLCVAKTGEAEALAPLGCPLLVTAPVVGRQKLQRLAQVSHHAPLTLVVDHPMLIAELSAVAAAHATSFDVMVDVDIGTGRTGTRRAEDAGEIAALIDSTAGLRLVGIQAYAGHVQHIENFEARRAAAVAADAMLREAVANVRPHLAGPPTITGSGTGSFAIDIELGTFTELQVGSYIFGDVEYNAIDYAPGAERPYRNSLYILARVVSANQDGFVTVDAGSKSISMDGPAPQIVAGCPAGTQWGRFGDEFSKLILPEGAEPLERGDLVLAVVPHCDPTINMFDSYTVVTDSGVVQTWPVDARGRSQ